MKCIRILVEKLLAIVLEECDVSPSDFLNSKKQKCVEARKLLIFFLSHKLPDCQIACITGLSRQVVNNKKNSSVTDWSSIQILDTINKRLSTDDKLHVFKRDLK